MIFTSVHKRTSLLHSGYSNFLWNSCVFIVHKFFSSISPLGAQWLSGRELESRPRGRGVEPHRRHCVLSLSKNINPSVVLVQPRKTIPLELKDC